jgi:endonuclease/exonuclease/phosphatase family metal-dependent hydrolase
VPDIEALAERLQMSVAYVPSMRNGSAVEESSREDRGNAVLSTEPLSDVTAIELPFGHQRRVAVMATVTPRGPRATPVRVIAVHLDTRSARTAQSAAFADQIRQLSASGPPIVVGADLNAISGFNDVAFKTVNASIPAEDCGRRSTLRFPPWRLDFIFSTLASSAQRTCETLPEFYGSDHRPLLMTIRY